MKLNINSEKKFEEQFANELNLEYGMTFQREFTLYDPVSKSNSRIDLAFQISGIGQNNYVRSKAYGNLNKYISFNQKIYFCHAKF